jgi:RNA polymerase sigma-70 factor (ECF subfamily)
MSRASVESSDAHLVRLARSGDPGAFGVLLQRHQNAVYNLAFRLTENRDLANEVCQETWIRAWRGLSSYRGEAAFSTWIYRITVNTAFTWRARRHRHPTIDLDQVAEPELATQSEIPEQVVETADLRRRLRAGLAGLSPALRTVVVMKDIYEWSHQEIAQALGISVAATKVRLHRAHQRLQSRLREGE